MTFKNMITSDLSVIFNINELADTIIYNGSSIQALIGYGECYDDQSNVNAVKANIAVKLSDVPSPAYDDTVVIAGVTWRVLNIEKGNGYVWDLNLIRNERPML